MAGRSNLSKRFSRINVDVISGTSAGGLNGVLLAQHFAYGAPFDDDIRQTWLRLGDLAGLTRRPWREASLSVLRGDHGFYPHLAETMDRLSARATPVPSDGFRNPVRLLVTATRARESYRPLFTSFGAPAEAASSAAYFKFVKPVAQGAPQHQHIGSDPASRLRLAYAARCTSAFPGAFEPGRIAVSRGESAYPSMHGASSETDDPDQGITVDLMDGGVLDNIPLAWALRGISASPAQGRVERWLLYLDPSPTTPRPTIAEQGNPSATGMTRLLTRAMYVKGHVETLLDDVGEFATARREMAVNTAALHQALSADPERIDFTTGLRDTYALSIGQAETNRFRRLLRDPSTLTAGDPLGVPGPFFTTGTSSHPGNGVPAMLQPMPPERERALGMPSGDSLTDVGRGATTPLVAARALTLLLVYIRHQERDPHPTCTPTPISSRREISSTQSATPSSMLWHTVIDVSWHMPLS